VIRWIAVALTIALAVPALATAATPKAPSGKYKLASGGTGSLKVKNKKLTSVSVVPKDASAACGTAKITVNVVHSLTTVTKAGYTNWIVGKATPKKGDGYQLVKTKFVIGGVKVSGKLRILWYDDGIKSGRGEMTFRECDWNFAFAK